MIFNIQPLNLIRALSVALELSAGGLSRHHWRTGMIARRIAEELDLDDWQRQGSRIVGVADVFVALTERRPYREPLKIEKVEEIMRGMVASRKLDKDIVADLFGSKKQAHALVDLASGQAG